MTDPIKSQECMREEEWENFEPTDTLSPDISGKLWKNIDKNTATPLVYRSYFKWATVAASIVLVAGLSWHFILTKQKSAIINASAAPITKNIFNNTLQKMMLSLSDGSTVELSPNSKLSFPETFNSLKRDVTLNGEATFNIAKDAARPFFVNSNSVLITVLGTRFTVNSFESDSATKVILHEGKVMVKTPDSSLGNKNEYYLAPGDVFLSKKVNKRSHVLHLEKDKDDDYVFDNYPFDVVFDQLQIIYNTKIIYNKAELGNRSFIGKIDKKDSLDHILKSITLLNKFSLHKQGDSYIISVF